jgi:hypothetical protein
MAAVLPWPPSGLRLESRGCAGLTVGCWARTLMNARLAGKRQVGASGRHERPRQRDAYHRLSPDAHPPWYRPYLVGAHAQRGRAQQHTPSRCKTSRRARHAHRHSGIRAHSGRRPEMGLAWRRARPAALRQTRARSCTGRRHESCHGPRIDLWCTCYVPGGESPPTTCTTAGRCRHPVPRGTRQVHRQGGGISRRTVLAESTYSDRAVFPGVGGVTTASRTCPVAAMSCCSVAAGSITWCRSGP